MHLGSPQKKVLRCSAAASVAHRSSFDSVAGTGTAAAALHALFYVTATDDVYVCVAAFLCVRVRAVLGTRAVQR